MYSISRAQHVLWQEGATHISAQCSVSRAQRALWQDGATYSSAQVASVHNSRRQAARVFVTMSSNVNINRNWSGSLRETVDFQYSVSVQCMFRIQGLRFFVCALIRCFWVCCVLAAFMGFEASVSSSILGRGRKL